MVMTMHVRGYMMRTKFATCLAMVCIMLLPLPARASNELVTLVTGETIEA